VAPESKTSGGGPKKGDKWMAAQERKWKRLAVTVKKNAAADLAAGRAAKKKVRSK